MVVKTCALSLPEARSNTGTRIRTLVVDDSPFQDQAKITAVVPPTTEEIRQRAHDIFMARGGTPGNELEDWLRAEQELKQERDGTNTNAT